MRPLELLSQSLQALAANRLRSALTLLGIVAGVASIIAVMTALALVQATMEREMSVLGSQTFQAQKWPAGGFASDAERRRAMRRPPLTLEDAAAIREQVPTVDLVGSELWDFGFVVEYKGESTNPNVSIVGGTPEYPPNNTHYVGLGRNLSPMDVRERRQGRGHRPRDRQEAVPVHRSDRARRPGRPSQVPRDRGLRREEVGVRRATSTTTC